MFSRFLDNKKVDIYIKPYILRENIFIQCKCTRDRPNYQEVLNSLPDNGIRVLIHRLVKKANTRFVTKGEFAILPLDDFLKILSYAKDNLRQESRILSESIVKSESVKSSDDRIRDL